ncbi:hypothetical protein [Bacillus atrophaeus]|nr:hypothetical protein [Bacillus atrophaeus]MCY8933965.1 hypothetical protein [Bacillus atrophaeus]MCY8943292.1 hypothetical protein [Bacillus atrophaeus]MCY8946717.1 hypothetical protein [Bacillus atrophaeus]
MKKKMNKLTMAILMGATILGLTINKDFIEHETVSNEKISVTSDRLGS